MSVSKQRDALSTQTSGLPRRQHQLTAQITTQNHFQFLLGKSHGMKVALGLAMIKVSAEAIVQKVRTGELLVDVVNRTGGKLSQVCDQRSTGSDSKQP